MIRKLLILLVLIGIGYGLWRSPLGRPARVWIADWQNQQVVAPEQLAYSIASPAVNAVANRYGTNAVPSGALPAAKNIAVPFTTQAPNANWDQDHEEFCEEASMLMVGRAFQHRPIANATDAEQGLQQIKTWELDHLGFYFDTTAAETAQVVTGLYGLKVQLKVNPSVNDIKLALANNELVIVPAAGRELGNPNFTAPGPIYHNFVIRGYTNNGKFITNDPGTRKGEGYVYQESVVMNAIHDWVPSGDRTLPRQGDVANGRKVILIVSPK
jgi:hypothetical protein